MRLACSSSQLASRRSIRWLAVAQVHAQLEELIADQYPAYRPLLITAFVTTALADQCKRLDLPFLDTAGNLYLRTDAFLVYLNGEPRPAKLRKDEYRAYQPAGLKLIFALRCRPTLVEAQYRELARFARVAFGVVGCDGVHTIPLLCYRPRNRVILRTRPRLPFSDSSQTNS